MLVTRREFLKTSAVTAGVAITGMGFVLTPVEVHAAELRKNLQEAVRTTTICPYCGVGCGFVVDSSGGKVINIEGDPEHPINEGTACSKGSALFQMAGGNNVNRLTTVRHRAPGADEWTEMTWEQAIPLIAQRIKATRDATFETTSATGATVNRTLGIGSLGSAAMDNEECWLYQKFLRALGMVYIEHQARN
ncbi:MAG: twin-arginine translocation signal domain-containing protein [Phycisphaerales bacterium]|nr:MAG: twin-arginine translocation signal domain-containing protein [Phycisphaerales bacterium]